MSELAGNLRSPWIDGSIRSLLWVGAALGILLSALAVIRLISHFFDVGLSGIPGVIVASYSSFVTEAQRLLIELPFHFVPPEWVKHATVIWALFAGSNWRFLTTGGHGERLITGVGDVGRGTRRGSVSQPLLYVYFVLIALSGPLFAAFVLIMWLGNRQPGPAGVGRWGDRFMIANRGYTVRISGLYLLILALAPLTAAVLLVWNAFS